MYFHFMCVNYITNHSNWVRSNGAGRDAAPRLFATDVASRCISSDSDSNFANI